MWVRINDFDFLGIFNVGVLSSQTESFTGLIGSTSLGAFWKFKKIYRRLKSEDDGGFNSSRQSRFSPADSQTGSSNRSIRWGRECFLYCGQGVVWMDWVFELLPP